MWRTGVACRMEGVRCVVCQGEVNPGGQKRGQVSSTSDKWSSSKLTMAQLCCVSRSRVITRWLNQINSIMLGMAAAANQIHSALRSTGSKLQ